MYSDIFLTIAGMWLQCLARTRYDFPFTLRFLRNFQKLSIKNTTTKLGNSPTRYDFFRVYRNVYAPGTVRGYNLRKNAEIYFE